MFNLEPTAQYTLANPPLAQALAQVRFPVLARVQSLEGIASLQEALIDEFPYMERVAEAAMIVGTSTGFEESVSWHFTNDAGELLVVGTNVATLSAGNGYVGISAFTAEFERVLRIIDRTLKPRSCEHVAVRFLNVVNVGQDAEADWISWFNGDVVGWSSSRIVSGETRLETSVSQIQLVSPPVDQLAVCPGEVQAVVRHGVATENSIIPGIPPIILGRPSFFLDMDLFVATRQPFRIESLIAQFGAMHSQIDRFFRWALTAEGEKHFGLEERK